MSYQQEEADPGEANGNALVGAGLTPTEQLVGGWQQPVKVEESEASKISNYPLETGHPPNPPPKKVGIFSIQYKHPMKGMKTALLLFAKPESKTMEPGLMYWKADVEMKDGAEQFSLYPEVQTKVNGLKLNQIRQATKARNRAIS